jgi:predicted HD superfamily hydrolase involved in NAD metabolism
MGGRKGGRGGKVKPWFDDVQAMDDARLEQGQAEFLAQARDRLDDRLHGHRLVHSKWVERTAAWLADRFGVDLFSARAAGLLHDWSKQTTDGHLLTRAREAGFDIPVGHEADILPVLHAPVGSLDVRDEFPDLPPEVYRAIARHTTGAADMSALDMVIYLADMIEPTRTYDTAVRLRKLVLAGEPLDELYLDGYTESMMSLFERRRYVYPGAVAIWNDLVAPVGDGNETQDGSEK